MPDIYRRISLRAWPLALLSALGFAFALFVDEGKFFRGPGFTLIYISCGAFLILMMEHSGRLTSLWIYRAIAQIGIYSYGLYLWHSAMLSTGEKILAHLPATPAWFVALGAQFAGAFAIAYATTRLIEWPALYYLESVPWLRDTKPLASTAEDPGPSHTKKETSDSAEAPAS